MVEPAPFEDAAAGLGKNLDGQASSAVGRFTNLVVLELLDSTNRLALDLAHDGAAEGLVVVADEQSAGRGRLGRAWTAPPGTSLLCSVLLRPGATLGSDIGFYASACVSLAALDTARTCFDVRSRLKWPNDLLVGEDKVAGVLAERVEEGAFVVGIGLNLDFSSADGGALPEGATSLAVAAGAAVRARRPGRDEVLESFLEALERWYAPLVDGDGPRHKAAILAACRRASATLGTLVRVELPGARVLTGRASALLEDGRLELVREQSHDDGGDEHGAESGPTVLALSVGDVVHLRAAPDRDGG